MVRGCRVYGLVLSAGGLEVPAYSVAVYECSALEMRFRARRFGDASVQGARFARAGAFLLEPELLNPLYHMLT